MVVAADDEQVVEALVPSGAYPALGERVGDLDRTGVRMIWVPIECQTSSKARLNLVSRSRIRWRGMTPLPSRRRRCELAGLPTPQPAYGISVQSAARRRIAF